VLFYVVMSSGGRQHGETQMLECKLVRTNISTRWPCRLCGGSTEGVSVLCESESGFRVCERCLEAGPEAIERRIAEQVAHLRAEACDLERLMGGNIKIPTSEEWRRAMDEPEGLPWG
jgi:hypothetical protein